MSFFDRIFGRKYSDGRIVSTVQQQGKAQPTPANYEGFSKEGYQKNVVAFSCVNRIAIACSSIPWYVKPSDMAGRSRAELNHPVLNLIKNPNPSQGSAEFIGSMSAFYALTGNTYIEGTALKNGLPTELWSLRPDKMKVIPGAFGMPASYQYKDGQSEKLWPVDPIKGTSQILQVKTFNPLNYWYGMSPMEAALLQIDQNNSSSQWNLSLLQNSATPSGILKVVSSNTNPLGVLKDDQVTRLRAMVDEKFSGRRNAGRPMVLENGLEWQTIAWSPKDMEFLESKNTSARDIALAFGVPPLLLNINGDNTFKNYAEARVAFYEDTIVPVMTIFRDAMNRYFKQALGNMVLDFDIDQIDAMSTRRADKFNSYKDANFLTVNEKRRAIGYQDLEGWDVILVGSQVVDPDQEPFNDPGPTNGGKNNDLLDYNQEEIETKSIEEKTDQGFKAFNLIGKFERKQSARLQNSRMRKHESAMRKEVESELNSLNHEVVKAIESVDPGLIDYTIMHAVDRNLKGLESVLTKHIKNAAFDFAGMILRDGKNFIDSNAEFKHLGTEEMKARSRTRTDQAVDLFLKTHVAKGLRNIAGTSVKNARRIVKDEIQKGHDEGLSAIEVSNNISKRMDGLSPARADLISRTEIGIASMQGSLEAAKSLGIPNMKKEWISTHDDRTRDNPNIADHDGADGQIVGVNEKFSIEPDAQMDSPKDPSAPPEQICNCRCVMTYSAGKE